MLTKFWYQNGSNPLKIDENIGNKASSKHKVDNFDHEERKVSDRISSKNQRTLWSFRKSSQSLKNQ